jgi:hypothetical protein
MKIEIKLRKNIFAALVVDEDFITPVNQKMSPRYESMDNNC